ncbi:MAG: PASTA domain-containing protein [Flavobacteriales bacterium]
MDFMRFIFSKTFLINILLAIGLTFLIIYIATQSLSNTTDHDERIRVPDLSKLTLAEADREIAGTGLQVTAADSAAFNPDYPPLSVVQQIPRPGAVVKRGRRIHLTLNPKTYESVKFRNIFDKSLREAKIYFEISNLKIGRITYEPYLAKGVVLQAECNGKALSTGDEVPEFSTIDLTVGKGLGNEIVRTPELLGMGYTDAVNKLREENLLVGTLRYEPGADEYNGIVYRQFPKAARPIREGTAIALWLTPDTARVDAIPNEGMEFK